jgi:hypothetical protein
MEGKFSSQLYDFFFLFIYIWYYIITMHRKHDIQKSTPEWGEQADACPNKNQCIQEVSNCLSHPVAKWQLNTTSSSMQKMSCEDYGCRSRVSGPMNTSSLLAYCECFLPCYFTNKPLLFYYFMFESKWRSIVKNIKFIFCFYNNPQSKIAEILNILNIIIIHFQYYSQTKKTLDLEKG